MAAPKRPQLDKGSSARNPFADAQNAKYAYNRGVASGYNKIEGSTPRKPDGSGGGLADLFGRNNGNGGMVVPVKPALPNRKP